MLERDESQNQLEPDERLSLGAKIASGAFFQVYEVVGRPDLVIKRYIPHYSALEKHGSVEAIKTITQREEEYVARYLSEFIPFSYRTELDLGEGPEEVVIQARNTGVDSNQRLRPSEDEVARIAPVYRAFCTAYRELRLSGAVIESVVNVDLGQGKIVAYDTNNLRYQETMVEAGDFFAFYSDQPTSFSAEDILVFLNAHFKGLPSIDATNEKAFFEAYRPGELVDTLVARQIADHYYQRYSQEENDETDNHIFSLVIEMKQLLNCLMYFPPAEYTHNLFTMNLGKKLGLVN